MDARDKAQLSERQLNEASEREKQLMNRLTAELIDKAAGAEALAALEARCADAEARIETTTSELNQARAALTEASAERVVLVSTAQAAEAAAVKADERLAAIGREERERREALAASLRGEAVSRHAALEDEVRTMEATIADLHHQLGRAARERGRSSDGLGSARYGGDAAALTLALLGASGASALALPTLTAAPIQLHALVMVRQRRRVWIARRGWSRCLCWRSHRTASIWRLGCNLEKHGILAPLSST
jgi:hypothetical protein